MADDLKYGYKGAEPTQSFGSNTGVFDPADINNLIADNKWTSFGQLELIETQTASVVGNLVFSDIKEDIYNVHLLTYNDCTVATDNNDLWIRLYENGVEETAGVYQVAYQYGFSNGTFGEHKFTNQSRLNGSWGVGTGTGETASGYHYFYNLGDSTKYSFQTSHWTQLEQSGVYVFGFGSGVLPQASVVDGIKFLAESGNFSGTVSLYGIRYS